MSKEQTLACVGAVICSDCVRIVTPEYLEQLESQLADAKKVIEAAIEVLEVADLRGDTDLPHPANDERLWTARMQTGWDDLRDRIAAYKQAKEKAESEDDDGKSKRQN